MSANVESMFYVRTAPWHGLGTRVEEALSSEEALKLAGLDWRVIQKPMYTIDQELVSGYKANVRDLDNKVLGIVSDRYKVVQNEEAFAFTDELLGSNSIRYETAGSLQGGKKVWMLAKLPSEYIIRGDKISPFLVFSNTHDGSGSVRMAITPIRVVCNNTLNLALATASRTYSMKHTTEIHSRLEEAKEAIFLAEEYMDKLGKEIEYLNRKKVSEGAVNEAIQMLLPIKSDATDQQVKNMEKQRKDLRMRYDLAPDLKDLGQNGYRLINAVSDFATHATPLRETEHYREHLFSKTVEGNPLIDKTYEFIKAA